MFLPLLHIVTSVSVSWDELIFLAIPASVVLGVGLEKLRLRRRANLDGEAAEPPAEGGADRGGPTDR